MSYNAQTMSSRAAVAVPRQNRLPNFIQHNWRLFAELLFLIPAYTAYQYVRGAVHGKAGDAFDNASRLIGFEERLHIFHEASLQQLILPKVWMVDFFNYLYIWGHLPVIIAVAIWLYTRHRENYALFRNAFLISGLIALIDERLDADEPVTEVGQTGHHVPRERAGGSGDHHAQPALLRLGHTSAPCFSSSARTCA